MLFFFRLYTGWRGKAPCLAPSATCARRTPRFAATDTLLFGACHFHASADVACLPGPLSPSGYCPCVSLLHPLARVCLFLLNLMHACLVQLQS